jgi:hypothetical protein
MPGKDEPYDVPLEDEEVLLLDTEEPGSLSDNLGKIQEAYL